eukprot:3532572-Pleurochrysis_carterae.AAC.1
MTGLRTKPGASKQHEAVQPESLDHLQNALGPKHVGPGSAGGVRQLNGVDDRKSGGFAVSCDPSGVAYWRWFTSHVPLWVCPRVSAALNCRGKARPTVIMGLRFLDGTRLQDKP